MDQSALVTGRIDDGRRFIERFAADGNGVRGAMWAKTADNGDWFLYVISDIIDKEGPATAYRAVRKALDQLHNSSLASSEIKVVGEASLTARELQDLVVRRPGRFALGLGAIQLGGAQIDEYYAYPASVYTFTQASPMTTEELGREIVRLMNRGPGILQPSRVTLRDGTQFNGLPLSLELGPQRAVEAHFIADGETFPRVIRLDEIAAIN